RTVYDVDVVAGIDQTRKARLGVDLNGHDLHAGGNFVIGKSFRDQFLFEDRFARHDQVLHAAVGEGFDLRNWAFRHAIDVPFLQANVVGLDDVSFLDLVLGHDDADGFHVGRRRRQNLIDADGGDETAAERQNQQDE